MVSKRGFTMLELLVIIGLVSILLSIGSVGTVRYLNQLKINEATRSVIDAIAQASNEAIRTSRELTFSTDNSDTQLVWRDGTTTVGQITLPNTATATITRSITNQAFSFTARGLPTQQLSFTIRRGNDTRTFILLVTGLVVQQ
ncbi:MAG: GspH/FimT family pseudopilin [Trueperaceae bacterium]